MSADTSIVYHSFILIVHLSSASTSCFDWGAEEQPKVSIITAVELFPPAWPTSERPAGNACKLTSRTIFFHTFCTWPPAFEDSRKAPRSKADSHVQPREALPQNEGHGLPVKSAARSFF